jgi:transcriptional regulator with XRE-family HTH domain
MKQDDIIIKMTFPEFLEKKYLEWQLKEGERKTIVQFAAYIGVSQPILSMWMSGKKRPGMENIKLLAEIFGDEVYDALGLPRPNPYLQIAIKKWEYLPEEKQKQISRMIAEEAAKYETKTPNPKK